MNRITTLERENQRLSQNNRGTFQQPGADIRLPSFLPGEGGRGSQVKGNYNDSNNAVLNQTSYKLATTNNYTPTAQTQYLNNQPQYLQTKSSYIPTTQTTQNNTAYYPVVQSLYNDAAKQQQ